MKLSMAQVKETSAGLVAAETLYCSGMGRKCLDLRSSPFPDTLRAPLRYGMNSPGSLSLEMRSTATATSGSLGRIQRFTRDMSTANVSAAKLAALKPDSIYFGHGEPLLGGADQALNELVVGF